jgi:ribosomal protein L32
MNEETKECLSCGETILKHASVCKYCGRDPMIFYKNKKGITPFLKKHGLIIGLIIGLIGLLLSFVVALIDFGDWKGTINVKIEHLEKEISYLRSHPNKATPHRPPVEPVKDILDKLFGNRNWFFYPDANLAAVGVKHMPIDFIINPPIRQVHTHQGIYGPGDNVPGDCEAHVVLDVALQGAHIPVWQSSALLRWKEAERNNPDRRITRTEVNAILGTGRWDINPEYPFSVIVSRLENDLPIEYPITCVDANNRKYGVGMSPVKAGLRATIWFAGEISQTDR